MLQHRVAESDMTEQLTDEYSILTILTFTITYHAYKNYLDCFQFLKLLKI